MMSFGTIRRAIHIESVFALSESENVAVFKRIKDNEQHSFLFRLCGQEVLYPVIPHIYSSVGYCIVYLIRVRHNLQIDRRNNLTLSFYTDPSFEVGGITLLKMEPNISKDEQLKKDIKSGLLGKTGYLKPNHIPYTCKQVTGNINFISHQPKEYNESSIDQWTEINCYTEVTVSSQDDKIPGEIPGLIARFDVNIEYNDDTRTLNIANISLSEHFDD